MQDSVKAPKHQVCRVPTVYNQSPTVCVSVPSSWVVSLVGRGTRHGPNGRRTSPKRGKKAHQSQADSPHSTTFKNHSKNCRPAPWDIISEYTGILPVFSDHFFLAHGFEFVFCFPCTPWPGGGLRKIKKRPRRPMLGRAAAPNASRTARYFTAPAVPHPESQAHSPFAVCILYRALASRKSRHGI